MQRKWLRLALLIPLVLAVFSLNSQTIRASSVVDPTNVYVSNFEGWGTSLAWWANIVGGWSSTNMNAIADLVFGPTNLNLNIVRYNIGASPTPNTFTQMRPGGAVSAYETSSGVYDWTVDGNQRAILNAGISRGVNIVEGFSNSPPWWMTINGTPYGGTGCGENLSSSNFNAFADYLTTVTQHFKTSWGITFRTLEALNEPNSSWWCSTGSQEGDKIVASSQNTIISDVGASLASKGLSGTTVSANDANNMDDLPGNFNGYSTTSKNYISQLNAHGYNGSNRTGDHTLAVSNNKRLWMSEYGVGSTSAIPLAAQITADINFMRPNAWIYWQAVENTGCSCTWGFMQADFTGGTQSYNLKQQFYGMSNYSRFIKKGYNIISSGNDANSVAAYSSSAQTLVIVTYNSGSSNTAYTYDLSKFGTTGSSAAQYRTSGSENLASIGNVSISNKTFTATANANSITTYVITGVSQGSGGVTSINDNTIGTGNNQFNYTGTWSYGKQSGAYQGDNHWNSTTNNAYQVAFTGTKVQIYSAKNTSHGIFAVSIDGGAETNVDLYASSRSDQVLVWTSPTLASGNHTVKVRVTGTKNGSSSGYAIVADRVDVTP